MFNPATEEILATCARGTPELLESAIAAANSCRTPMLVLASNRDLRETTKIVDDQLKKNIEPLNGVGQVRFVGDRKRQIQVVLDPEKLFSYNLKAPDRNARAHGGAPDARGRPAECLWRVG